jgi:hypothetical protein
MKWPFADEFIPRKPLTKELMAKRKTTSNALALIQIKRSASAFYVAFSVMQSSAAYCSAMKKYSGRCIASSVSNPCQKLADKRPKPHRLGSRFTAANWPADVGLLAASNFDSALVSL